MSSTASSQTPNPPVRLLRESWAILNYNIFLFFFKCYFRAMHFWYSTDVKKVRNAEYYVSCFTIRIDGIYMRDQTRAYYTYA
jgi:hypothetical protein